MNYQYTVEDLARYCQVSKQSIYNLINKNKDFVNDNSRKQGRKIKYNQAVLNLFLDYYGKETAAADEAEPQEQPIEATETPLEAAAALADEIPAQDNTAAAAEQIAALQAEIADLKQQLADKEAERKELLQQNGALILTIQQQQQERMLLLPAPRKTLGEKIRGIFGRKEEIT